MDAKLDAKLAIMYLQQACSDEYIEEFREEIKLLISIAERAADVEGIHKNGIMRAEVGENDADAVSRWLLTGEVK